MKKKVVLIRPPHLLPSAAVTAQHGVPSLALAYLAGALRKAGYPVQCVDAVGEALGVSHLLPETGLVLSGLQITEILKNIPADVEVIGESCGFSNDWLYVHPLLSELNERFPKCPIVVGGEHVSADYARILTSCPFITACILGEGEQTLVELMAAFSEDRPLAEGKALAKVRGLAYLDGTGVRKTGARPRMAELDTLAWPAWDLLPLEKYLDRGYGMAVQGQRSMPMLATRGCPHRCTFCSVPNMWNSEWHCRNPQDIAAEAESYKIRYGITHLEFYDMSPLVRKDWLEAFCQALGKLQLSWNFPSGLRAELLDEQLLSAMKNSGCYKLTLALETSSARLNRELKKHSSPSVLRRVIREACRQKLITKVNLIFGLPGQKVSDILLDYLNLTVFAWGGLHDVACFAFVPYPGSALANSLLSQQRAGSEADYEVFLARNVYNNTAQMKSWSEHIPDQAMKFLTLGGMAYFYFLQFLFRPYRFFWTLRRIAGNKPESMLELALTGRIWRTIPGQK